MPKYRVGYFFDGEGYVDIEAENEKEAEATFYDGGWEEEQEGGQNYVADKVELI